MQEKLAFMYGWSVSNYMGHDLLHGARHVHASIVINISESSRTSHSNITTCTVTNCSDFDTNGLSH